MDGRGLRAAARRGRRPGVSLPPRPVAPRADSAIRSYRALAAARARHPERKKRRARQRGARATAERDADGDVKDDAEQRRCAASRAMLAALSPRRPHYARQQSGEGCPALTRARDRTLTTSTSIRGGVRVDDLLAAPGRRRLRSVAGPRQSGCAPVPRTERVEACCARSRRGRAVRSPAKRTRGDRGVRSETDLGAEASAGGSNSAGAEAMFRPAAATGSRGRARGRGRLGAEKYLDEGVTFDRTPSLTSTRGPRRKPAR